MAARFGSTRERPGYLTFRLISQASRPSPCCCCRRRRRRRRRRRSEETFALDAKIALPRIIDYKLLVSLP